MKDIHSDKKPISTFFNRFHLVIFTVLTVLMLSVAVILLSGIVEKARGTDSTPEDTASFNFDQPTIDKIKELKTSNQPSEPLDLSQGRINPFGE